MSPNLDAKLVAAFQNLYRDRHGNRRESGMCFGFQHDDGWFQIIWDLSDELEKLILELPEAERHEFRAFQVKEKFGTLRFYMAGPETGAMTDAIQRAEDRSASTCEMCGKPGKLQGGSWVKTVCEEHETPRS